MFAILLIPNLYFYFMLIEIKNKKFFHLRLYKHKKYVLFIISLCLSSKYYNALYNIIETFKQRYITSKTFNKVLYFRTKNISPVLNKIFI